MQTPLSQFKENTSQTRSAEISWFLYKLLSSCLLYNQHSLQNRSSGQLKSWPTKIFNYDNYRTQLFWLLVLINSVDSVVNNHLLHESLQILLWFGIYTSNVMSPTDLQDTANSEWMKNSSYYSNDKFITQILPRKLQIWYIPKQWQQVNKT